jgi:hypothetical protein
MDSGTRKGRTAERGVKPGNKEGITGKDPLKLKEDTAMTDNMINTNRKESIKAQANGKTEKPFKKQERMMDRNKLIVDAYLLELTRVNFH